MTINVTSNVYITQNKKKKDIPYYEWQKYFYKISTCQLCKYNTYHTYHRVILMHNINKYQ